MRALIACLRATPDLTQRMEATVKLPNGAGHVPAGMLPLPAPENVGALLLEAVPGSVAHGRHWVVAQVEALGISGDAVMVAELLTSELVANAVRHGPPAGLITVRAAVQGNAMSVTVTDQSQLPPVLCFAEPEDLGGRGMQMIQALATAWGVELHDGEGKSIWFRVQLDESAA